MNKCYCQERNEFEIKDGIHKLCGGEVEGEANKKAPKKTAKKRSKK